MMERLIAHARQASFEQIELEVVSANRRAISLYVKYGFKVYGTRPHGLKYADGSYADDYMMQKVLVPGPAPRARPSTIGPLA